jgi:putative transposase
MKRPPLLNNNIYHIYNRGVEKRDIFMDDKDYLRFLHSLFEFNDNKPSSNFNHYATNHTIESRAEKTKSGRSGKIPLVDILAFTLMPNHYHLLVRQKEDGGISKFIHKLATGYTLHINDKYNRSGALFQGKFKAILIENHAQLLYIPNYIHLNPLALQNYGGRTSIVLEDQIAFLEKYRWSSLPDYMGIKNFPSLSQRGFLLDLFGGEKKYKQEIIDWIQEEKQSSKKGNSINKILLIDAEK